VGQDAAAYPEEIQYDLDRASLIARLPKGGVGAEVGSWRGDFAAQLLAGAEPRTLYLIDPWAYRGQAGYEQAMYGDAVAKGQESMDAIHDSVLERFREQTDAGRVSVWRKRSGDAARELAAQSFDWIYIDGDHTYDAVKADLEAFLPLVRSGGILAGDDYGDAGWWGDGVTRAVDELATSIGRPTVIGKQFLFQM
jgi:hypothetical protein